MPQTSASRHWRWCAGALATYIVANTARAGESGPPHDKEPGVLEISYGPNTEACPEHAALHRAIGRPADGLRLTLRFRRTPSGYGGDLLVAGRLNGKRSLETTTCAELEGALILNVNILDRISQLTDAQKRANRVAALLIDHEATGGTRADTSIGATPHGTFAGAEVDTQAALASTTKGRRPSRHGIVDLASPPASDRYERWSVPLDFIGLFGVVRNGILAVSAGVNWRFREHWRVAAALVFAPPREVSASLGTSTTTAMASVSTGVCRTLIRNWSISSLEACGSLLSGAVHISSRSVGADMPWVGLSTELVLDASITRNLSARIRGGVIIPIYNPSTSLPELAGAHEFTRLGALTGVGLIAHFE